MRTTWSVLLIVAATASCARRAEKQTAAADSLGRDLQLAPVDTTSSTRLNDQPAPAPKEAQPAAPAPEPQPVAPPAEKPAPKPAPKPVPRPPATPAPKAVAAAPVERAPAEFTVAGGTEIHTASNDSINSWHDKPGKTFTARVSQDVTDANGRVAIPAGSTMVLEILELKPAENKSAKDGTLKLRVKEIQVRGQTLPVLASVVSAEHTLKGRGVRAGDAAKVGIGAAGGAVAGGLIGGKTGAIVGGLLGAAGGTAVATQTYDRDVIISPGNAIVVSLDQSLTVPAR